MRYIERKGRGRDVKTEWSRPTGRIQLGASYIFIYAALRKLFNVSTRSARLWCTLYDCAVNMTNEFSVEGFQNPVLVLWNLVVAYKYRLIQLHN